MLDILTLFLMISLFDQQRYTNGLQCYMCKNMDSCTSEEYSYSDCDTNYCTIFRRELQNSKSITAFYRSCENEPTYLNTLIETTHDKTYYQACSSDFCNSGDGINAFSFTNEDTSFLHTIIVPGIGSYGTAIIPALLPLILIQLAFVLAIYYE